MIQTNEICKSFGKVQAVNKVSLEIRDGEVFGLVGTNGAGKSTLLRMLCGILKPDSGSIRIQDQPVYENVDIKRSIFYISDEMYFFANSTPKEMEHYYRMFYPNYKSRWFFEMLGKFGLEKERKINTFSKGMKKQLSFLLGLASGAEYLLCDETFDGLDPVMRQTVKSLFAEEMLDRKFTPVIASHNLRELEDVCDHVGLLHRGGVLLSRDLEDMKFHIHKVQCVFSDKAKEDRILKELQVLRCDRQGSLMMITVRGTRTEILERIKRQDPLFCEIIPLTLEEIFISETEVAGYEIKNLIC